MKRPKLQMLKPRVATAKLTTLTGIKPIAAKRIRGGNLQRRNREVLRNEPLCRECSKLERVRPATQVDHITPLHLGGTEDHDNLQPLCDDCHDAKNKREAAARATGGVLA